MDDNNPSQEFFNNLLETWRSIILKPKEFFATMPISGGFEQPLIFVLIMSCLSAVVHLIFSLMVGQFNLALTLVSIPLGIVGVFIGAGIMHLFVLMFGGRNGFEATLRVIAYSQAIAVFSSVPILGLIVVPIWGIVLSYIGLKHAQELSTGRAAGVVLMPYVIALILLIPALSTLRETTRTKIDDAAQGIEEKLEDNNIENEDFLSK